MLEGCDNLNGLVISCSMSGGTGSGLTNLILESSRYDNMLAKKTILVNMVLPSPKMSDTVV
jgi:tubulin alpha